MSPMVRTLASGPRRLAYREVEGRSPAILFLPGYMSDMEGTKALALEAWAVAHGHAFRRFDYGGCGISPGEFAAQSLADWRDDAVAMIDDLARGPAILVGSSMGGWLMLLAALARPDRVAGLIGIAAAPDFTDWGFNDDGKARICREGRLIEENYYGDDPCITTRIFWESGQALRVLGAPIPIDCPVRLLHGQRDREVPENVAHGLAQCLRSADVQTLLVKSGDHRLSRDADLALLTRILAELIESL